MSAIETAPARISWTASETTPSISEDCMSGRSFLIFGDIEGKLDVLRVECTKCARKGRYSLFRLIEKYGRKPN
jgi:hypothetical protein